jgi:hypothetical protein
MTRHTSREILLAAARTGGHLPVKRRQFISLLASASAAWPMTGWAQRRKGARIGFLPIGSPSNAYDRSLVEAFQQGLRRVGLIENEDIVLDVVWTGDDPDRAVRDVLQRGAEMLVPLCCLWSRLRLDVATG